LLPACSSGSGVGVGDGGASGTVGAATCESAGKRICERACACGSSPTTCKTGFRNSFGSFASFTWSDAADCEGDHAVNRCRPGGRGPSDLAACASEIESTACDGDVFVLPAACEPLPKDAG